MSSEIMDNGLIRTISSNQLVRTKLIKESVLYFSTIYFPHYFQYDFAPFHLQMFRLIEDADCLFSVVVTFRGSGKSTLFTTISPLWSIMGKHQKKHVLIVCQTQEQARSHLSNIKLELETNDLLHQDLGPFKECADTWNSMSLEFSKYGAKISAISIDQSIRGVRYKQYRPDLIVADDIEDSNSVRTKESRKHIQEQYSSEIAPLGDINTKVIMVGNYLHPNSLLATLNQKIQAKTLRGTSLFVPLINDELEIAWPRKFPTMESIQELRERVANDRIWTQEYLLKIVPDDDQIITHDDISWYDDIPTGWEPHFQFRAAGIDLAISKESTADYTALVSGTVYRYGGDYHIFIDRNPTNKRFSFRETINFIHGFHKSFPDAHLFIESTAYQRSLVEQLTEEKINAHGVQVGNIGKRERLSLTRNWISKGHVHFPTEGSTDLVNQIVNFGAESHDDLVDAFTLLIQSVMGCRKNGAPPSVTTNNDPIFMSCDFNRRPVVRLREPSKIGALLTKMLNH